MTLRDRNASRLLVPTVLLLAVVGCSEGDDDGVTPTVISALPGGAGTPTPDETPDTGDTPPEELDEPVEPAFATLDGDWLRSCTASDPTDPGEGFEVLILSIAGNTATQRELYYGDSGCRTPATPAELTGDLSFVLPGGTTETSLGTAAHFDLDIEIESVTIDGEPLNAAQQQLLEQSGEVDTLYDIVLISGSELYFGDSDADPSRDGDTPERRPNVLDTRPYLRQ